MHEYELLALRARQPVDESWSCFPGGAGKARPQSGELPLAYPEAPSIIGARTTVLQWVLLTPLLGMRGHKLGRIFWWLAPGPRVVPRPFLPLPTFGIRSTCSSAPRSRDAMPLVQTAGWRPG